VNRWLALLLAVLIAGGVLNACGKKGPLKPPEDSRETRKEQER